MKNNGRSPVGIFDSGIGGLTVAKAITEHLPEEEILYFGDTAHLPYGDKSQKAIQQYSEKIYRFLMDRKCKLVVIACNTASSLAFDHLRRKFKDEVPIINVIDPVVEAVANDRTLKNVGIIGTKGTISSNIYEKKLGKINPQLSMNSLATPLLAPMIEEGFFNSSISNAIINAYLNYPDFQYMDAIILACTHYPLISREVLNFYNGKVKVFDSTDAVALSVKSTLEAVGLLNEKKNNPHHFFVSDYTVSFEKTTKIFYREQIRLEEVNIW